jgi:hypothetical protein
MIALGGSGVAEGTTGSDGGVWGAGAACSSATGTSGVGTSGFGTIPTVGGGAGAGVTTA